MLAQHIGAELRLAKAIPLHRFAGPAGHWVSPFKPVSPLLRNKQLLKLVSPHMSSSIGLLRELRHLQHAGDVRTVRIGME